MCRARDGGDRLQPLQSGILTGSFSAARAEALPDDDWRSTSADFRGEQLGRNLALVEAIRPIAASLDASVGELAIAWVLSRPGVTGAIVGARSPEHVDGWIRAPALELDQAHLEQIAAAIEGTGAGEGPVQPAQ